MQTDRDAQAVNWLGRIGAAGIPRLAERVTVLDLEDVAGLAAHALARGEARNVLPA